jgi:hypothetical protein
MPVLLLARADARRARRSSGGCRAPRAARTARARPEDVADPLAHLARVLDDVVAEHARLPEVGISSVISILIVVVFPAPLGPSSPKSSPSPISKLTPRTASTSSERRLKIPVEVL